MDKTTLATTKRSEQNMEYEFMNNAMSCNRKFRTFNVIDDCLREALAIEVDTFLSAKRLSGYLTGLLRLLENHLLSE